MKHPFSNIPPGKMRYAFIPLLAATLVLMFVMNLAALPLETEAAPYGIISFELAGSAAKSYQIIASWDESARLHAAFNIGLDYLFLALYSTTVGLACVWAGGVLKSRAVWLAAFGVPLAWGQWLAATLDAIENTGLTLILFGGEAQFWAPVVRSAAIIKFAIIFVGLSYAFLGLVALWGMKPER